MIKIGVTGGIGSGKTTVCKHFESLGVPVYFADEKAKRILTTNLECKKQLIDLFGEESYLDDGSLNRIFLSKHVFKDSVKTAQLNTIVHPLVEQDFNNWITEYSNNDIIIKEAALLFETESYKNLDKIIVVDAPEDVRIERVLARDVNRDANQVRQIIARQIPQSEKVKRADYVIENSDKKSLLIQVKNILNIINGKN